MSKSVYWIDKLRWCVIPPISDCSFMQPIWFFILTNNSIMQVMQRGSNDRRSEGVHMYCRFPLLPFEFKFCIEMHTVSRVSYTCKQLVGCVTCFQEQNVCKKTESLPLKLLKVPFFPRFDFTSKFKRLHLFFYQHWQ